MNGEHYSDPTADIAVSRVMREWKKEVIRNGKQKSGNDKVRPNDIRRKSRVWKKRRFKKGREFQEKKTIERNS